jgi:beta-xylosidase
MTTVSRAKHPAGPWDDSPFNPLVHTWSESDAWWHQGHGSIIEGPDGGWWTLFPARPRHYTGMGKQSLLLPVEWTADGWPRVKNGHPCDDILAKPRGENVGGGMPLSDEFEAKSLAIQWNYRTPQLKHIHPGGGKLVMDAQGEDSRNVITAAANGASVTARSRSGRIRKCG